MLAWRALWHTQGPDYDHLLPALAALPTGLGRPLAALRGRLNAGLQRDWRSMSLRRPHVAELSLRAFEELAGLGAGPGTPQQWLRQRFLTESRCDFEACFVNRARLPALHCATETAEPGDPLAPDPHGRVLLTAHFDSFFLGIVFLGQRLAAAGRRIDVMSSAVFEDPQVHPAIVRHLRAKYRGLERYLNGGRVMHLEDGLRQFYEVLERGGILVVIGDAPPLPGGVSVEAAFLGARRTLAGGALRMARRQGSRIASFTCTHSGGNDYRLRFSRAFDARDPTAADGCYGFLSSQIMAEPGRWWAADMLPQMPGR